MSALSIDAAAALAALAGALLLPAAPGPRRRRALVVPSDTSGIAPQAPLLRPGWLAVAVAAGAAAGWAAGGPGAAAVLAAACAAGGGLALRRAGVESAQEHPAELAGRWELLAVCLQAGLPVAAAVLATAAPLQGSTGRALRRVAGLLELGADPAQAWRGAQGHPALATFARAAARSAGTGTALAHVARDEEIRVRAGLADAAQARAQRAGVLITGPLGLCFLPAFVVLGIVPVLMGLAREALARW